MSRKVYLIASQDMKKQFNKENLDALADILRVHIIPHLDPRSYSPNDLRLYRGDSRSSDSFTYVNRRFDGTYERLAEEVLQTATEVVVIRNGEFDETLDVECEFEQKLAHYYHLPITTQYFIPINPYISLKEATIV